MYITLCLFLLWSELWTCAMWCVCLRICVCVWCARMVCAYGVRCARMVCALCDVHTHTLCLDDALPSPSTTYQQRPSWSGFLLSSKIKGMRGRMRENEERVFVYGLHVWCTCMVCMYGVRVWCACVTCDVCMYDVHVCMLCVWCAWCGCTCHFCVHVMRACYVCAHTTYQKKK